MGRFPGFSDRDDGRHDGALQRTCSLAFPRGVDGRDGRNDVSGHISGRAFVQQACQEPTRQRYSSGRRQGTLFCQDDTLCGLLPCSLGHDRACLALWLVAFVKQCSRSIRLVQHSIRRHNDRGRRIPVQLYQVKVSRILRVPDELFHEEVEETELLEQSRWELTTACTVSAAAGPTFR